MQESEGEDKSSTTTARKPYLKTNIIRVKLNFDDPDVVSRIVEDSLSVEIKDELLIYEPIFYFDPDATETTFEREIVKLDDGSLKETAETVAASSTGALAVFLGSNLILGIFLSFILTYLWGMINSLQIVTLTTLFTYVIAYTLCT